MASTPEIVPASDRSTLVVFEAAAGSGPHPQVERLTALLLAAPHPCISNVHPGAASVLVVFDPRAISHAELGGFLTAQMRRLDGVELPPARRIEIPVCYTKDFGPDLSDVAAHAGVSIEACIELHGQPEYRVQFLGFTPGFAYLGGLDPRLAVPRLTVPRTLVPAGSVAIGASQTGVYPVATPGGWRILGRTPLRLFRPEQESPVLLAMGDRVRFRRITLGEFDDLSRTESRGL